MTFALLQTIIAGLAVLGSSACLTLWQILSAPDRPNYPTSGRVKRAFMFWFAAALAYRGVEILYLAHGAEAFRVTDGQALSSVLMLGLFGAFLTDHLRHWLPGKTHQNIRRLMAVARCRPSRQLIAARTSAMVNSTGAPCPAADVVSPAIIELQMQGVRAIGPGAGPEAVTGADR